MTSFSLISCLLIGATVLGIMTESEVELSSDVLNCFEEIHPLYQEFVTLKRKCEQEYPTHKEVFNHFGNEGSTVYKEDRRKCMAHYDTPKVKAKLADINKRCGKIINALSESQFEKVDELMKQEVWSRPRDLS